MSTTKSGDDIYRRCVICDHWNYLEERRKFTADPLGHADICEHCLSAIAAAKQTDDDELETKYLLEVPLTDEF